MIKNKTKKGAASIYAVVFVTLLLGVTTVSFVRLTLRESTDTTNSELSSSSYDAALAGVEDAKRAIQKGNFTDSLDCFYVSRTLYSVDGEVLLGVDAATSDSRTEQAYTCVTVNPESESYEGSLNNSNTVAIIPLRRRDDTEDYRIDSIKFEWQTNKENLPAAYPNAGNYENLSSQSQADRVVAPVISYQYLTVDEDGDIDPINDYAAKADSGTASLYLTPTNSGIDSMTKTDFLRHHNGTAENTPTYVTCDASLDYICSFTLTSVSNKDANQYLVVSLPYGQASSGAQTDFRVTMKHSGSSLSFYGVQFVVDSTGRANDLYTRLEVRLNSVDPNFPYPQFALQTEGSLEKYFWVAGSQCYIVDNGNEQSCTKKSDLLPK